MRRRRITAKQYTNGKTAISGVGGNLYKSILDAVIALYNGTPKRQALD